MIQRDFRLPLSGLLCLALCSCGPRYPMDIKPTVPVTGEVYVDGKPAEMLEIACHNIDGTVTERPRFSRAIADEEGRFALWTYFPDDGVREGRHALTFAWTLMKGRDDPGPDRLRGRYSDPQESEHQIDVVRGKPIDLGRIELTTK